MKAVEKLARAVENNDSRLCVGLDTDIKKIPKFLLKKKDPVLAFNKKIVAATGDLVCAYKLNMAFYEALGLPGIAALKKTVEYIPENMVVILDGKRGDIGNTAQKYAAAIFDYFGADATTLNPYMGEDSILPFSEYRDKLSFILCLTSNPTAREFQFLKNGVKPLYLQVADRVRRWNKNKNLGLVVGATFGRQIKEIRKAAGRMPFLIPGVGSQKGDLGAAVQHGSAGGALALINSSRDIIYASPGKDFAVQARLKAIQLYQNINSARN
jgi:orotidine-5'-phosphate decarboxylase